MRTSRVVAGLGSLLLLVGACTGSDGVKAESVSPLKDAPAAVGQATPTATPATTARATAAPCTIPPRFTGVDVERLPLVRKRIALTFDGGANSDAVRPILDTLATRRVPATFFLTGGFVETFPKKARRIANDHLVGNHTMTHPDLTTLTNAQVRQEIRAAEAAILSTTREDPRRFLRFPFGARDARVIRQANRLCYVPFRWTVDSLGWKGTSGGMTVAKVVNRVVGAAEPGAIVLMHVGSNPDDHTMLDAAALPQVIRRLRQLGYVFVPLSQVMNAAP